MSRRRNQHRQRFNKSMSRHAMSQSERRIADLKASEGFAPNEAKTSSIARVNGLHKSEYAVHGEFGHRGKLRAIKAHNKSAKWSYAYDSQFSLMISDSSNRR